MKILLTFILGIAIASGSIGAAFMILSLFIFANAGSRS